MMLTFRQEQLKKNLLSPLRQRFYYLHKLPMAFITGTRLIHLDESRSVSKVPFFWRNKNPFHSMYFAVQSMAAEISTAAPVMLSLASLDADVAMIIVELNVEFVKKAQSRIEFTCVDYDKILDNVSHLKQAGDTANVVVKTTGRDADGDEVAVFYFTWSFKQRA